jgi:hypothetical protein
VPTRGLVSTKEVDYAGFDGVMMPTTTKLEKDNREKHR